MKQFSVPCTWFNIRRASRAVTQQFDHALHPCGLRISQLSILYSLKESGPARISEIAEMLVMDRTTLTRNLQPLEKNGYVVSGHGKDRRTRIVRLTAKGRKCIKQAMPHWKEANSYFIRELGFTDWNRFMALLAETVDLTRTDR